MGQIDSLTILIFITYPRLGIFSYLKFHTSPTIFFLDISYCGNLLDQEIEDLSL